MVQFNTPAEEEDVWGMVSGRSIKALSFSTESIPGSKDYISLPLGTEYTLVTTESLQKRQATDFNSGDPKHYDDGKPIFDLIATGQTEYADPTDEEDDGKRRLYFTGSMRRALQDELRAKKISRFGIGTRITVKLTGFKPNPKGKPTKLFDVTVVPTEWVPVEQLQTEAVLNEAQFPAAVRPAPAAPAAPPVQDFAALLAQAAATQAAQAPAAPVAPVEVEVDPEHVKQVRLLIGASIDRASSISTVAENARPGDAAYAKALDELIEF